MFKVYYQLAKPGIIYGNAVTAIAGFFLAAKGTINWPLFVAMLVGLSLVIGGACVFNNIYDRDIDASMARTKDRATVTGQVSRPTALIYGTILFLVGAWLLWRFTNNYALLAALVGFVTYVCMYTPLKRKTVHATLIGSISGATPPVVGYCAVAGRFDLAAGLLFLILVFWQMPHFYAIAVRRLQDYAAAGVPVLPVAKSVKNAKVQILLYIIGFIAAALLLAVYGFAKYTYAVVVLLLGLWWLALSLQGFKKNPADDQIWAKKVFLFSLVVITILSVTMCLTAVLP